MLSLKYLLSKGLKKLRGSAILTSKIHPTSKIESGSSIVRSTFDRHSFCGYDCIIIDCEVGAFCSIASGVVIGGSRHPIEWVSTSPVFLDHKDSVKTKYAHHQYVSTRKTLIGNDVWIGDYAMIKAGVSIGDGAVVGMGSVVTKDVKPYAIVAGNPAKLIRMRFEPELVDAFMQMKWWQYDDEKLSQIGMYFDNPRGVLTREGFL